MKRPLKNRPFIKRFLVSYFLVLLLPIIFSYIILCLSTNVVESYAEKSNKAMINQIRFSLDQRLDVLENLVFQLSQMRRIENLSKQKVPLQPDFYFNLNRAINEIQTYFIPNNSIATDHFLILLNSRTVTDGHTVIPFDTFFGSRFQYNDWSKEQWLEYLSHPKYSPTFLGEGDISDGTEIFKGIPMIQTVPFYYNSDSSAIMMFLIKENDIISHFYPEDSTWTGVPHVYDSQNHNLLAGADHELKGKYITINSPSDSFDIVYGLSVPYNEVFMDLLRIRTIMFIASSFILILTLFIAIIMAQRNANPLRQLYNMISDTLPEDDLNTLGYESLNGSVTKLITSNEDLRSNLQDHKKIISEEFCHRLVKYGFDTPSEMDMVLKFIDKSIPTGTSGILLMNLPVETYFDQKDSIEEIKGLKLSLMELLQGISSFPAYWMDLDDLSIGYIYSLERQDRVGWFDALYEEIKVLTNALRDHYDLPFYWSVGNPVDNFFNLNSSYRQSKIVADELVDFQVGSIYEYRNFIQNSSVYSFPIDLVQKLFNLTKSGDTDMAISLFKENWTQNLEDHFLSRRNRQIYFLELRSLLTRIDPTITEVPQYFDFHTLPQEQVFDMVIDTFYKVGQKNKRSTNQVQSELKDQLLKYLEENFDDPNITLCSIADEFGKSESYISHIYKKGCGTNFYGLLEGFRMEKAKKLLIQTDLSIKDISDQSGYSSMHSFRRAFKKIFGISPSAFRSVTPSEEGHTAII